MIDQFTVSISPVVLSRFEYYAITFVLCLLVSFAILLVFKPIIMGIIFMLELDFIGQAIVVFLLLVITGMFFVLSHFFLPSYKLYELKPYHEISRQSYTKLETGCVQSMCDLFLYDDDTNVGVVVINQVPIRKFSVPPKEIKCLDRVVSKSVNHERVHIEGCENSDVK